MKDLCNVFDEVYSFVKYKEFWLSHCPIHPDELRGKKNIHGHCVDGETEILTSDGWVGYSDIKIGQALPTVNIKGVWETDVVSDVIVHENYKGSAFHVVSKGLDMLVSDQHRVLFLDKGGNQKYLPAEKAFARANLKIIKSALPSASTEVDLSDDMLMLYIWLVADGNITPYDLCRVRVLKQRKVASITELVERMCIRYTRYEQKDGCVSLHFRLPKELNGWVIKGLDDRLVYCSRHQAGIVRETYKITDGNRDLIFTSKKRELDILQAMFVLNGYSCKAHTRTGHGFSKGESYQLSVTDNKTHLIGNAKKQAKKIEYEGVMWCVTTTNSNFIARRNGSVFMTGNCHYKNIDDSRYFNTSMENIGYAPIDLTNLRSIIHSKDEVL